MSAASSHTAVASLLLAGCALYGCVVYGKVQDPIPALDLAAPLRLESVLRGTHTFDGSPALRARIWVNPPEGTAVVLADSGVELRTPLDPAGVVARGELRALSPEEGAPRAREVRVAAGRQVGVTAFLPLPEGRIRPGAEFRLAIAWRLEPGDGQGRPPARQERVYQLRVQRTNYGMALGIAWLLGASVVAVSGP
jgi:hypothetical protein